MDGAQIIDVGRDAILTMLMVAGPLLIAGLAVGVTIALFQSVTQIQEMTLTFIPKILAVFVTLQMTLPYMGRLLSGLFERVMDRIIGG